MCPSTVSRERRSGVTERPATRLARRPKLDEVFRNDAGEREISLSDFLMQVNRSAPKPPSSDKRGAEASWKGKMPAIKKR